MAAVPQSSSRSTSSSTLNPLHDHQLSNANNYNHHNSSSAAPQPQPPHDRTLSLRGAPYSSAVEPLPEGQSAALSHYRAHHSSSPSTSSVPRNQRSGGLFAFAAAAIDRTQNAFSNISDQKVRPRQSLSRLSIGPDPQSPTSDLSPDKAQYRTSSNRSSSSLTLLGTQSPDSRFPSQSNLVKDPPSQPYSETDRSHPPPILLPRIDNKMHQTSSRLLRMTDDDRPFTKVSWTLLLVLSFRSLLMAWRTYQSTFTNFSLSAI